MAEFDPWKTKGASEIKWGEDTSIENVPELSAEDRYAIQQKMTALDKILAEQGKAKYKIELMFGRARSLRKPTPGMLTFWESGMRLHGGGDTKMYICPGKTRRRNECEAFIPMSANGYGFLICPECQMRWTGDDVFGEIGCVLSMADWSRAILKHFIRLGHNADIYVKMSRGDIRALALLEQQRQHKGEKLALARDRPRYIYPLKNLIKDCSAGSDLLKRLYAFLTA